MAVVRNTCSKIRPCVTIGLVTLLLTHTRFLVAQALKPTEAAVTVATQDPAARALLEKALVFMGGRAWVSVNDFKLAGTEHEAGARDGDKGSAIAVSGTSKGKFRMESTRDGRPVHAAVFDGEHTQRRRSTEAPEPLPPHAAFGLPPLFPLPVLAAAITSRNVAIIDRGSTQWDGVEARVVETRSVFPSPSPLGSPVNRLTAKLFYINPASGQLMGISFRVSSIANSSAFVESSVHYSDFSADHGITYPHTVTEYFGQQPIRKITFTDLATNNGLEDSHFHF